MHKEEKLAFDIYLPTTQQRNSRHSRSITHFKWKWWYEVCCQEYIKRACGFRGCGYYTGPV